MMRAKVRIQANGDAKMLARALKPEVHDEVSRSKMDIEEESGDLVISFEAEDVVALRAALNSYLRWAKLAIDTKKAIGVLL
jgi:tRNA threonylcarbamoyladenosine modification (KEOPS) complex  Pcc1 subunit